jgi:hypothetical protein
VTVLAILNLVLGGLNLFGLICGGLVVVLMSIPATTGLVESIPGFIPYIIITSALGTIMTVVLLVAGFGLLKMRRWARTACLVWAVYTILSTVAGGIYTFAVVQPAAQRWEAEFEANRKRPPKKGPGAAAAHPDQPPVLDASSYGASTVANAIVGGAYAVVLLVVLSLASARPPQ